MAKTITNPNNTFTLTGRLAANPRVFDNLDGSLKVYSTIITQDPVTGTTDAVPVKAFIPARTVKAGKMNDWDTVHKDDLVRMNGTLHTYHRTDEDGTSYYTLDIAVQDLTLIESVADGAITPYAS